MSGKPPKSEGPRDSDKVSDSIARGRTLFGCVRNTFFLTLVAVVWLVGNIYAQYLPLPWLPKPSQAAPSVAPNPVVSTLAPAQTPQRTATPIPSPTPRR